MSAILLLAVAGGVAYVATRNPQADRPDQGGLRPAPPNTRLSDAERLTQLRQRGVGNGGGVQRPAPAAVRVDENGELRPLRETSGPREERPPAAPPPSAASQRRAEQSLVSEPPAKAPQIVAQDAQVIERILTTEREFGNQARIKLQYIARIRAADFAGNLDLGGGRVLATGQDVKDHVGVLFTMVNGINALATRALAWSTGQPYRPGQPAEVEQELTDRIRRFNVLYNLLVGNQRRRHSTRG